MGKPSLQEQLTKARNELELSTFLNKGVLQTNSEQKLRIAELEVENDALRKAESLLTKTEEERDYLLKALRQLQSKAASMDGLLADAEARARKGDDAVDRLSSVQRSLSGATEEAEAWKLKFETLLAAVNTSQRIFAEATPSKDTPPFATPSSERRRSSSHSKRRRVVSSEGSSEGPSDGKAVKRRGRRYEGSGDDSADGDYAQRVEDVPPRTRSRRLPAAELDISPRRPKPKPRVSSKPSLVKSEMESDLDPLGDWDDYL